MQLIMGKFMLGAGGALLGMKDPVATLLLLLAAADFMVGHAIEQRCKQCRALLKMGKFLTRQKKSWFESMPGSQTTHR